MTRLILILLLGLQMACHSEEAGLTERPGNQAVTDWRLLIQLPDVELPARLHLSADGSEAWVLNGLEKVNIDDVSKDGENWRLHFPAFNNTLVLREKNGFMEGELTLVKRGYKQLMPVRAEPDSGFRFLSDPKPESDFTGRWQVTFVEDDGKETTAIGEFDQQGSKVRGTFLTPLGDYRFLAGEVDGDMMYLSTFDGAHAFVFQAQMLTDGSLKGDFWSGTRWHESWTAQRNFEAKLPDAYSLTFLKDGYDRIEFNFPDLDGNPVALTDEKYRDRVVLVTLSGSWCPNCADEIDFLSAYYNQHHERGLEIVTLLYERYDEFDLAARQGRALQSKHGVNFDILIAGNSDKTMASETLPMLNHVLAFPTMIFIDRKGVVRMIHTGFSGPGTGQHYTDFVEEFNVLMDDLLDENL